MTNLQKNKKQNNEWVYMYRKVPSKRPLRSIHPPPPHTPFLAQTPA